MLVGSIQNFLISNSRVELCDVENLVAIQAESFNDLTVYALIGQEHHAALSGNG